MDGERMETPGVVVIVPEPSALRVVGEVTCVHCGKTLPNEGALLLHERKTHPIEGLQPKQHNAGTVSADSHGAAGSASATAGTVKAFYCPIEGCARSLPSKRPFPRLGQLKQHYGHAHASKEHECPACKKLFGLKDVFNRHVKMCGKEHVCSCSPRIFPSRAALLMHIKRTKHAPAQPREEAGDARGEGEHAGMARGEGEHAGMTDKEAESQRGDGREFATQTEDMRALLEWAGADLMHSISTGCQFSPPPSPLHVHTASQFSPPPSPHACDMPPLSHAASQTDTASSKEHEAEWLKFMSDGFTQTHADSFLAETAFAGVSTTAAVTSITCETQTSFPFLEEVEEEDEEQDAQRKSVGV